MNNENRKPCAGQDQIPDSDSLRAAALGLDPGVWADARLIAPMLQDGDLRRAIGVLQRVGGLGYLLQQDTPGLTELDLSDIECQRIQAFAPLASRVLCTRSAMSDPRTRRELAEELSYRGLQFDTVTAGVIAWDADGRRVADRVIAIGTKVSASLDLHQALRVAVCSGRAQAMVLWIWRPEVEPKIDDNLLGIADELRIMGAALRVQVQDVFLLGLGAPVSLCMLGQWQP